MEGSECDIGEIVWLCPLVEARTVACEVELVELIRPSTLFILSSIFDTLPFMVAVYPSMFSILQPILVIASITDSKVTSP